jgi:hypothetical protein
MGVRWFAYASANALDMVMMTGECPSPPNVYTSGFSKEEEQLLDAMMSLFTGIEDNTRDDCGSRRGGAK